MLALLLCVAKSFPRRGWGFRPMQASGPRPMRRPLLIGDSAGALARWVFGA